MPRRPSRPAPRPRGPRRRRAPGRGSVAFASLLFLFTAAGCGSAAEETPIGSETSPAPGVDLEALLDLAVSAQGTKTVLQGPTGWLFLPAEDRLRRSRDLPSHLPERGSGRVDDAGTDPLSAIVDFDRQLAARGIELLFVPVPTKLAIYPEMLAGLPLSRTLDRLDGPSESLRRALERAGVETVDLFADFTAARAPDPDYLYLATDSHWSPRGSLLAARAVAAALRRLGVTSSEARGSCGGEPALERAPIRGDLAELLPAGRVERELVLFRTAVGPSGPRGTGGDRPGILVLGDSHLAVWRARKSGFVDQLEAQICEPLDEIAVQAGGATASRRRLTRHPELLAGKKAVVWVVSTRLYVSGPPWARVPLPN